MRQVVAIVGPTASGKTALSVGLAERLDGEIINGDSMQVYQQLNIGTAKITEEEKRQVPHHFFDILSPTQSFSVAEYQEGVRGWIDTITARDKTPIIVGGTGLYIQSVLYNFQFTEDGTDRDVRKRLEEEVEEIGKEALHQRLEKIDPKSAQTIHPNNVRRVIRALEIYEVTGKTKTETDEQKGMEKCYESTIFGLHMPREQLYARIDERVNQMVHEGLVEEVHALYKQGIPKSAQAIRGIGYKELYDYFDGHISKEEAIRQIQQNTRRYAKRQMTYFRNKLDVVWLDATLPVEQNIATIYNTLK